MIQKQSIPPLFQEIIDHSKQSPKKNNPVNLNEYVEWEKRRRLLIIHAERYFSVDKGNVA